MSGYRSEAEVARSNLIGVSASVHRSTLDEMKRVHR
jgi:hypothetical protein